MSALTRSALTASPLADLHLIAAEIGIDGFRKLRKADLIAAILTRSGGQSQGTEQGASASATKAEPATAAQRTRRAAEEAQARGRRSRARRSDNDANGDNVATAEEIVVTGVVELGDGGTGFIRTEGESDDVYISAAQIRRCDLVDGDRVSGPMRSPRRSERHPSIVRVDTVNDHAVAETSGAVPFDALPCEFPTERLMLAAKDGDAADSTLAEIDQLTPIGRGSRVTISGGALAGKSELLRRIAAVLNGKDLELTVVLTGVRPEEVALWRQAGIDPAVIAPLGSAGDSGLRATERALDVARRLAARGRHCVLAIDTLDYLGARFAARALGSARNLSGSGSVTVIATVNEAHGGETTMIVLDRAAGFAARRPMIDRDASATLRPELLEATAAGDGAETSS